MRASGFKRIASAKRLRPGTIKAICCSAMINFRRGLKHQRSIRRAIRADYTLITDWSLQRSSVAWEYEVREVIWGRRWAKSEAISNSLGDLEWVLQYCLNLQKVIGNCSDDKLKEIKKKCEEGNVRKCRCGMRKKTLQSRNLIDWQIIFYKWHSFSQFCIWGLSKNMK